MGPPPETTMPRRPAASVSSLLTPPARETCSPSPTTSPSWTRSEPPTSETRRKCSPPLEAPRRCAGLTDVWPLCLVKCFRRKKRKNSNPDFNRKPKTNRKTNNKTFKNNKLINIPTDFIIPSKQKTKLPNAWAGWVIFFCPFLFPCVPIFSLLFQEQQLV